MDLMLSSLMLFQSQYIDEDVLIKLKIFVETTTGSIGIAENSTECSYQLTPDNDQYACRKSGLNNVFRA